MVYSGSVRRNVLIVLLLISVFIVPLYIAKMLYQFPYIPYGRIEEVRKTIDKKQTAWYDRQELLFRMINSLVYHNGDKYLFRPPRIAPSHTFPGRPAYSIYGIVTSWNPKTKLLEMDSYVGTHIVIQFDPDYDKSVAFMPNLDKYGKTTGFGENDWVTGNDNPRFENIFCQSDILMVLASDIADFSGTTKSKPLIPKEIRLSHRVCGT